jgi:hypothetical protein
VFFVVSGMWDRSSRGPQAAMSRFTESIAQFAGFVMPGLMLVGVILARRQVRLKRGDRVGAFRVAFVTFGISLAAWLLGATHIASFLTEVNRVFAAVGKALFEATLLWLVYLGVEPYVRRLSPDSLIGWTRLLGGQWRDAHVGRDVLIGISAGMAMTLCFAVHNLLPPLVGRPAPMPAMLDPQMVLAQRVGAAFVLRELNDAIQSAMLGTVGVVVLGMLLRRRWAAMLVAIVIFTPVAVNGMFAPGTPLLDLLLGAALIAVFVIVIASFGLLAATAALAIHFVLLRAPVTTDLSQWWAPTGLWMVGLIVLVAAGAATFAAGRGTYR